MFNVIQAVSIDDMTLVVVSIDAITGRQAVSIDGMTLAVLSIGAMIICFVCECSLVHPWFFPKGRLLKY